jgi:hypothetical protein
MKFLDIPEEFGGGTSTAFSKDCHGNRDVTFEYKDRVLELRKLLGLETPAPVNSQQARERGLSVWIRAEPCSRYGHPGIRTLKGECYFCVEQRNRKSPRQQALARKETWYQPNEPCPNCGQLARRRVNDGLCLGCNPGVTPRDIGGSPRQQAISDGKAWYTPTEPCKRCGQIAERRVDNGTCRGCQERRDKAPDQRRTPATVLMESSPDLIISRDDARTLGMPVFRTGEPCKHGHEGFRYVSTGNCIDCLRGR